MAEHPLQLRGSMLATARLQVVFPPDPVETTLPGSLIAGDSIRIDVEIVNRYSGTAENLAGAQLRFMVKAQRTDADADAIWDAKNAAAGGNPPEITGTDLVHGKFRVVPVWLVDPATLAEGIYHYGCQVKLGALKYTVLQGQFLLRQPVIKA